jgi:uncharacterized protein (TIGR02300 family)
MSVAKPEWGIKRICPSCGARYYDLRKDPPVCPTCGAQYDPEALLKSRRARPTSVEDVKKLPLPLEDDGIRVVADDETALEDADDVPVGELEEEAEDEEDVLIEDASELGEDDMGEVVDGVGVGEDEESR